MGRVFFWGRSGFLYCFLCIFDHPTVPNRVRLRQYKIRIMPVMTTCHRGVVMLSVLLLLLLGGGCVVVEEGERGDAKADLRQVPIRLSASIGTRMDGAQFAEGDQVTLRVVTSDDVVFIEDKLLTYDGAAFQDAEVKWYGSDLRGTVTAWYGAIAQDGVFRVSTGQAGLKAFNQSDLLIARKSDVVPAREGLTLDFDHMMSLLEIVIVNPDNYAYDLVTARGSYTTARVDLEDLTVSVDAAGGVKEDITCRETSTNNYAVHLVPQTAALTLDIRLTGPDSDQQVLSIALQEKQFLGGYNYRTTITLRPEVPITQVPIVVTPVLSAPIAPWQDGGKVNPAR